MASARFVIRRARAADAAAIAEVYIESRRGAARYFPTVHSDDEIRGWIASYLAPNLEVWVAEDSAAGKIIGMLALEGELVEHLYIAPAAQRRGVGDGLLALAMRERPATLRLWTFQANAPARRFYEARGFKAIEFTDGARNEERTPDVLYEWNPRQLPMKKERTHG
ncbi:MAG: GNAT family N-acetyltransferase [Candidatus Binataceae bacterium]